MYFLYSGMSVHPIEFLIIMTIVNVSDFRLKYPIRMNTGTQMNVARQPFVFLYRSTVMNISIPQETLFLGLP